MADTVITTRRAFGDRIHLFTDYSNAAITTGTAKREWIIPFPARIVDVIVDIETAGSGGTSDIVDVNINGTTIYTTQANRPVSLAANTGMFTEAAEPEVVVLRTGDIISYDIDQVCTTGGARFKIMIVITQR